MLEFPGKACYLKGGYHHAEDDIRNKQQIESERYWLWRTKPVHQGSSASCLVRCHLGHADILPFATGIDSQGKRKGT